MATQDLMNLISRMEGFGIANTLATKNNNPGNLIYVGQAGAIGKDSRGFAIFGSPQDGWSALERQINLDADRGLTLQQFIYKYAPPSENDTSNYLSFITEGLQTSASTLLSAITGGNETVSNVGPMDSSGGSSQDSSGVLDIIPGSEGDTLTGIVVPVLVGVLAIGIINHVT